ncbi:MAG TPA: hypothetical protein VGG53_17945 [Mycobacterium sp.]|jgi:hypothetical protein|uniref:hypothetical protein n=1 Tax=Mycobacterium sp. TaxID=1785 RepID=UPI002F427F1B
MGRRAATFWHATSSVAAGVLYFFFVLPRWPELMGDTSHALGTAARIVAGVVIALAALPVVFTLLRSRKPEFGTPALALSLQTWSVVAHVLAGVLIVGTAISEIWLSLDNVGQWLFGVYGAAAAIAVLGIFAFYLSSVAELPPPPPKPLKPKKEKKQRRRRRSKDGETEDSAAADETDEAVNADEAEAVAADDEAESPEVESAAVESEAPATEATEATEDTEDTADTAEADSSGGLRNRRPTGKGSHRLRRSRRSIAVDE